MDEIEFVEMTICGQGFRFPKAVAEPLGAFDGSVHTDGSLLGRLKEADRKFIQEMWDAELPQPLRRKRCPTCGR